MQIFNVDLKILKFGDGGPNVKSVKTAYLNEAINMGTLFMNKSNIVMTIPTANNGNNKHSSVHRPSTADLTFSEKHEQFTYV